MKTPMKQKVSELLLHKQKNEMLTTSRKMNVKIETRKIHPEFLIPETTKYKREEIFKRDFLFRNENQGVFKEDYIKTMFEMLYYNKKQYYINRNQLSLEKNIPVFTSCQYPNLNIASTDFGQSLPSLNKKPHRNNKSRNNCHIGLMKTYTLAKRRDDTKETEQQKEEEYSLSFDSTVQEKYDPHHKVQKQIKILDDLCKKYDFYDRKKQCPYSYQVYSPRTVSKKKLYLNSHTPNKRALTKNVYSNVNQFQLSEETSLKNKIQLTPNQVLSSKLFANKITKLRINSQKFN